MKVTNYQLRKEKRERGIEDQKNYIVIDDIDLDSDEIEYLNIQYKFREYEPPDPKQFKIECESRDTKIRWEFMDNPPLDKDELEERKRMTGEQLKEVEEKEKREKESAKRDRKEMGNILDAEGKKLTMRS